MGPVQFPALRLSAVALALSAGLIFSTPQVTAHADGDDDDGDATVLVDGGTVTSSTTIDISADGGTAIADAAGGDNNVAITAGTDDGEDDNGGGVVGLRDELVGGAAGDGGDVAAAGNGGTANASANGGAVLVGDVNSGGNQGNTIVVGDTGGDAPAKPVCCPAPAKPAAPKAAPAAPKAAPAAPGRAKVVTVRAGWGHRERGGRNVGRLLSTGVGVAVVRGQTGSDALLLAAGAILTTGAAGVALRRRFA